MDDNDTLHITEHTRIAVTIEPEAAHMLDEQVTRLYPSKRASQARAEIIEQGILTIYRRTFEK